MNEPFDLIVVGGGVNGAGIARDAAGRGAKVLMLEACDLASGTSSKSTKLVHGGLRYLEYGEFALVREALRERETLWSIAPHLVRPMRFVLPVTQGMRPRWMLRTGLFLYDHLGGRTALPGTSAVRMAGHPAGVHLREGEARGLEYSDCWVDDARLVALNALDAAQRGAEVRTHHKVARAARTDDGGWRVETDKGAFHGSALVNAGGPGADDVAKLAGEAPAYGIRRVRGSHIVVPRQFAHDYGYILQLPDTRICFVLPYEGAFTLIGTTDRDHEGNLVEVAASDDEVDYLLAAFTRHFDLPLGRADVFHTYAGVRALVDDGSGRPEAATRGYRLPLSPESEGAPLLGVYGGKITSYRHLAEEAVDELAARLPALAGPRWTAQEPLPGGDFPSEGQAEMIADLQRGYPFLAERDAVRIGRAYGTRAAGWLGGAKSWGDLGRSFGAGLTEAEVDYLRREEWARAAEDVLWRRSKLGLHTSAAEQAALAEWMGG